MTIASIHEQARKIFDRHELLRARIEGRQIFPFRILLKRITSGDLAKHFSFYRDQFFQLQKDCREHRLSLNYRSVKTRQLGEQQVPTEVVFPTEDIFLSFIGKTDEFETWLQTATLVCEKMPFLKSFLLEFPQKMIAHLPHWSGILDVLSHLLINENTNQFIRQLEIPGIDTKFVEEQKRILLDIAQWVKMHSPEQTSLKVSTENFEAYFGLGKEEPRLRFRLLDPRSSLLFGGLRDIEAPVSQIAKMEIPYDLVFIVENKTPGLLLPDRVDALVFFELGYKANLLKEIPWLKNKKIIYWGDIDTHGFAILSQLRNYLPHIQSRLMDQATLLKYTHLWTHESQHYIGDCPNLSKDEGLVFENIRSKKWGNNVRLEQERIPLESLYQCC